MAYAGTYAFNRTPERFKHFSNATGFWNLLNPTYLYAYCIPNNLSLIATVRLEILDKIFQIFEKMFYKLIKLSYIEEFKFYFVTKFDWSMALRKWKKFRIQIVFPTIFLIGNYDLRRFDCGQEALGKFNWLPLHKQFKLLFNTYSERKMFISFGKNV